MEPLITQQVGCMRRRHDNQGPPGKEDLLGVLDERPQDAHDVH